VLSACTLLLSPSDARAYSARAGQQVMGTTLEATVVADTPGLAEALAARCVEIVRHWDDVLTTWRAMGELEFLNGHAGEARIRIGVDLHSALSRMLDLEAATGGAFNPAVGADVARLRREASIVTGPRPIPTLREALTLTPGHASIQRGIRLDAGAVGKGIALDAAAAMLAEGGARAWFLDFGGSSQTAYGAPDERGHWLVAIAGVRNAAIHGTVWLRNASLSTSRATMPNDSAGAIIDPRSARPVAPPRLATVLAPDATSADAWSTAMVVLGRDGLDLARAAGVAVLYEDAQGTATTPDFPLQPWPTPFAAVPSRGSRAARR
jgi:thiamine biosynthesis lipoprotein